MKVWDFLPEFTEAVGAQLKEDDARWGETWIRRTREGQELRTRETFRDYFDQYENAGVPVPWLKIVGAALICWVRENHPELWEK